jgi:hypothetical protein
VLTHAFNAQDDQFQRAFDVLRSGINQRAFPGAAAGVVHQGKLIALKGLGRFTYAPSLQPSIPAPMTWHRQQGLQPPPPA